MKHLIDLHRITVDELRHVLETGHRLRAERNAGKRNEPILASRTLAMIFEKPSLRTRVSFEQAMYELGGNAIYLPQEVAIGNREPIADVARVLSGMVQGIVARVFEHEKLVEMARWASIPVINALSDSSHPCQALADIMTMQDEFGHDLGGRKLAYVGDGNNVARSLARICAMLGVRFSLAAPAGFGLEPECFAELKKMFPKAELEATDDPRRAVHGADAVYTDTWVSMGQEDQKASRIRSFEGFEINDSLMECAPGHAIVLHCLPAYRGYEISDLVIESARSRVFPQAHNRLHAQKGLLAVLMAGV